MHLSSTRFSRHWHCRRHCRQQHDCYLWVDFIFVQTSATCVELPSVPYAKQNHGIFECKRNPLYAERMRVNTCVNKLLFQALELSFYSEPPPVPQLNSLESYHLSEMHGNVWDILLCELYSSASVPKWPQKQSQSILFQKIVRV